MSLLPSEPASYLRALVGPTALLITFLASPLTSKADEARFHDEEVRITTSDPDITLAGTISIPEGGESHPGLLFLTGSGGHTRDQVISGLPMFEVLGDYLAGRGFVVLRVDDRGAGDSTGPNVRESSMDERTDDARAALEYLLDRTEVDSRRVGLLGHSEGAMTAPRIAVDESRIAFLVLLAPPSVPGATIWVRQQGDILRREGEMSEEQIRSIEVALNGMVRHIGLEGNTDEGFFEHGRAACLAWGDPPDDVTPQFVSDAFGDLRQAWYQQFFAADPQSSLRKLRQPVLALFGEEDQQVLTDLNLPALVQGLVEAGNNAFTVTVLPDEGHFFMRGQGLAPNEHSHGQMELSRRAMLEVGDWLARQVDAME